MLQYGASCCFAVSAGCGHEPFLKNSGLPKKETRSPVFEVFLLKVPPRGTNTHLRLRFHGETPLLKCDKVFRNFSKCRLHLALKPSKIFPTSELLRPRRCRIKKSVTSHLHPTPSPLVPRPSNICFKSSIVSCALLHLPTPALQLNNLGKGLVLPTRCMALPCAPAQGQLEASHQQPPGKR